MILAADGPPAAAIGWLPGPGFDPPAMPLQRRRRAVRSRP
jgi:hypothetical protein